MKKRRPGRGLFFTARTFGHFSVDFACAVLVTGAFLPAAGDKTEAFLGLLAYNLTAFALQPVMGMLCDAFPRIRLASWSCGGVLAALLWAAVLPSAAWGALVLCALGNALFHAGAGREVLLASGGQMKWGGVFVSSGALGVPLGMLAGGAWKGAALPLPAVLLLAALYLLWRTAACRETLPAASSFDAASALPFGAVLALALLSVAVRAFVGSAVPMPWKTGWLVLLPGAASCLGKAWGGFLADRFGAGRTGVLALALSLPLLCLGQESPWLSAAGLLCFNCTMPVSLGTVASKLPRAPGLAFGLTAQFLIVGSLPLTLWAFPGGTALPVSAALILFSALCIGFSSNNKRCSEPRR